MCITPGPNIPTHFRNANERRTQCIIDFALNEIFHKPLLTCMNSNILGNCDWEEIILLIKIISKIKCKCFQRRTLMHREKIINPIAFGVWKLWYRRYNYGNVNLWNQWRQAHYRNVYMRRCAVYLYKVTSTGLAA